MNAILMNVILMNAIPMNVILSEAKDLCFCVPQARR